MRNLREFKNWLAEPIDGRVLGLFRVIFGLFMVFEAWVYYRMHLIDKGLMAPKMLFRFEGFDWLPLFPQPVMMAILGLMGVSALFIAMGVFFSVGVLVVFPEPRFPFFPGEELLQQPHLSVYPVGHDVEFYTCRPFLFLA